MALPPTVDDEVFAILPENGDPIAAGALAKLLPKYDQATISHALRRLWSNNRAGIIYGRGWRRLPS